MKNMMRGLVVGSMGLVIACQTSGGRTVQVVEHRESMIDATGGSVALDHGSGTITIPTGALGAPTEIAISKLTDDSVEDPPGASVAVSPPIALTPHGQQFLVPVTVQIAYAGPSAGLSLVRLDDETDTTWELVGGATFADGIASFQTTHFSVVEVVTGSTGEDAGAQPGNDGAAANDGGRADDAGEAVDAYVVPGMDAGPIVEMDAGPPGEDAFVVPGSDAGLEPVDSGPPGVDSFVCTPFAESCNAYDDDCDGLVDEGACGGVEFCNGVDDDGNGTIDDNVMGEGDACGTSVGICVPGTQVCTSGTFVCMGGVGPMPEDCSNGQDDDCNGAPDDCSGGVDAGPPCLPLAESCNAHDDDCDGLVDESACGGMEYCNGVDDDGNGTIDDGVPGEGATCGHNIGACRIGHMMCVSARMSCEGGVSAVAEICGNGQDDDCNGFVDDCMGGVDAGAPVCDVDGDGYVTDMTCGVGPFDCNDGDYATSPGATEACDSADNDCDGRIDEGACG
ncbi:MAG: MopE-related protein [Sandaracinus sp.]